MARIWYSVVGDGLGHAVRSHTVLQHLSRSHELIITASGNAYPFLKKRYGSIVHEIKGHKVFYKDNKAMIARTFTDFVMGFPSGLGVNTKKISLLLKEFRPNMIISDFEPASHYFSLLLKIPCISIDNIHVLTECKVKLPVRLKYQYPYIAGFIKFLHPRSDHYIIPSFISVKPKNPRKTRVVNPIIREKVKKLASEDKGFVLVYQTSPTNTNMIKFLRRTGRKYKIYGMGNRKGNKKIKFKGFSEHAFLEDLRKCEYVIVNGGFTVISEALFLGKPVLSVPVKDQFEQEFNAFSLEKEGLGMYAREINLGVLRSFEEKIGVYKKNVSSIKKWGCDDLFSHLDNLIKKYGKHKTSRYGLLEKLVKSKG